MILRPGAISIEMIREILPNAEIADSKRPEAVRSPGMKYRHYAPLGMVKIVGKGESITDAENAAFIGCSQRSENFRLRAECQAVDEYAAKLFEFLRECDRQGIRTIYCEAVAPEGIGRALMDRLRRAAGITES
jgi:L-threonylcarbamoyladenylate synthase